MTVQASTFLARLLLTALGSLLPTTAAHAGNGLNDVGYGTESAGLAGADLALARDTAALGTNPAGLTQIGNRALNLLAEPYVFLNHYHRDAIGNDQHPDDPFGGAISGGYAQRLGNLPIVAGIGLFVQGGTGFAYSDFRTPFGTQDDLSAQFGAVKLASGLAWQIDEQWSLGAAFGLLYSTARQKAFPQTSNAAFSGFRVDDLKGYSANLRVGAQYRPHEDWVFGAIYSTRTPIRLRDGRLKLNNTATSGRYVTYHDVDLSGLSFAPELGVGVRYTASPRLTLVSDLTWLQWSKSMRESRLTAREPDDPTADAVYRVNAPLAWRDMYLFAIGGLYQWNDSTVLRGGVSYSRQPVPKATLDPLLALTAETTISAGFSRRLSPEWEGAASVAWQPPKSIDYERAGFGSSREYWNAAILYFGLIRRW